MLDLYHRTTPRNAARILDEGRFTSKENTARVWFSTQLAGQAAGYGTAAVHVRMPRDLVQLDDEFPDGEEHYTARADEILSSYIVGIVPG